jgi:hypothetical protein
MSTLQLQEELWNATASSMLAKLESDKQGDTPFWLSTSGLGVYWMHVRIDVAPKYYTYAPFRSRPV